MTKFHSRIEIKLFCKNFKFKYIVSYKFTTDILFYTLEILHIRNTCRTKFLNMRKINRQSGQPASNSYNSNVNKINEMSNIKLFFKLN